MKKKPKATHCWRTPYFSTAGYAIARSTISRGETLSSFPAGAPKSLSPVVSAALNERKTAHEPPPRQPPYLPVGAAVKSLRAWAIRHEDGRLVTFTTDAADVELFPSPAEAERVRKAIGAGDVVQVEITVVNEGMR